MRTFTILQHSDEIQFANARGELRLLQIYLFIFLIRIWILTCDFYLLQTEFWQPNMNEIILSDLVCAKNDEEWADIFQ